MEPDDDTLSLVTFSHLMNTTTGNQGNHCVIAICQTRAAVDQANQSLITTDERCRNYKAILGKDLRLRDSFSKILGTSELGSGGAG